MASSIGMRTLDILNARLGGGSTKGLFLDESKRPYKQQQLWGLGSALGINPHTEDRAVLLRRYDKALREFEAARRRDKRKSR